MKTLKRAFREVNGKHSMESRFLRETRNANIKRTEVVIVIAA